MKKLIYIVLALLFFILQSCTHRFKISEYKGKNRIERNLLQDSGIYVRNGIRYDNNTVPLKNQGVHFKSLRSIYILNNDNENTRLTVFSNKKESISLDSSGYYNRQGKNNKYYAILINKVVGNLTKGNDGLIKKYTHLEPSISMTLIKDQNFNNVELKQNEILLNFKVTEVLIANRLIKGLMYTLGTFVPPFVGPFIWSKIHAKNKVYPSGFLGQLEVMTPDGEIIKTYNQSKLFSVKKAQLIYKLKLEKDPTALESYKCENQLLENLINQFYNDSAFIKVLDDKSNEIAKIIKDYPETSKLLSLKLNSRRIKVKLKNAQTSLAQMQAELLSLAGNSYGQSYALQSTYSTDALQSAAYSVASQIETNQNANTQANLRIAIPAKISEIVLLKKDEETIALSIANITGDNAAYQYLLTENVKYLKFVELNNKNNEKLAVDKAQSTTSIYETLDKSFATIKTTEANSTNGTNNSQINAESSASTNGGNNSNSNNNQPCHLCDQITQGFIENVNLNTTNHDFEMAKIRSVDCFLIKCAKTNADREQLLLIRKQLIENYKSLGWGNNIDFGTPPNTPGVN